MRLASKFHDKPRTKYQLEKIHAAGAEWTDDPNGDSDAWVFPDDSSGAFEQGHNGRAYFCAH